MKPAVEEIKRAILHPEPVVRRAAAGFFAKSFSRDPTVMPIVVDAIKKYSWADAFDYWDPLADLVQSDDTFLWFVEELRQAGAPNNPKDEQHCFTVSRFIVRADAALLGRHGEPVLGLPGLPKELRAAIEDRLSLLTVDSATCWRQLAELCEAAKTKQYVSDIDLPHAQRLVEAIARDSTCAYHVLAVLAQKIANYEDNPLIWLEGLAARLAGEMRLGAAAPLLVEKLMEDGDWVNEECVRAVTRIGTDAAVQAIAKDFETAPWHYRLYASGALEDMRCDLVVPTCLALYGHCDEHLDDDEGDSMVPDNLIRAVLCNFAPEGIEPARKLIHDGSKETRDALVAVATFLGVTFPELPDLLKEEHEQAERIKRFDDTGWTFNEFQDAVRRMADTVARGDPQLRQRLLEDVGPALPALDADNDLDLNSALEDPIIKANKAGRNDPCPCGSGKKYKKCCMDKERDA